MAEAALKPVLNRLFAPVRPTPTPNIVLQHQHGINYVLYIPFDNPTVNRLKVLQTKGRYVADNNRLLTFCEASSHELRVTGTHDRLLEFCREVGIEPIER